MISFKDLQFSKDLEIFQLALEKSTPLISGVLQVTVVSPIKFMILGLETKLSQISG